MESGSLAREAVPPADVATGPAVKPVRLQNVEDAGAAGPALFEGNLSLIEGVTVRIEAVIGSSTMSVGELFALQERSVIQLDADTDAPVEVRLNGRTIATGRLVVVEDHLGVAIEHVLAAGK